MQVAWNFTFHACWIAEWYHPISKHCMCPHLDGSYWYLLLASVQRPGDQAPGCCALQGVGILQGETLILRWAAWTFPRCFWRFQGWIDVKRLNRYKLSALNEMHSTDRPSYAIKHLAHTSLHPEPACNLQSPDYMQLLQTAIEPSDRYYKQPSTGERMPCSTGVRGDHEKDFRFCVLGQLNCKQSRARFCCNCVRFQAKQDKTSSAGGMLQSTMRYVTTKVIEQSSDCIIANLGHFFQTGEWAESAESLTSLAGFHHEVERLEAPQPWPEFSRLFRCHMVSLCLIYYIWLSIWLIYPYMDTKTF